MQENYVIMQIIYVDTQEKNEIHVLDTNLKIFRNYQ